MDIKIFDDAESLSQAAATHFIACAKEAVDRSGRFSAVLTGGSSPKRLYELLASDFYQDQVPWKDTHIFFGDERWVLHNDARNNARMAHELLLNHVPIPHNQIVRMSGELAPEVSANQYESILQEFFKGRKPEFDLVLLGMGDDGHTLSLFPGTDVLQEKNKWVSSFFLKEQSMYRITLTLPIVNEAKNILFLVMGSNKAQVLKKVIEAGNNPPFPAEYIKPNHGKLIWFVDIEAGKALST
ncbi:MAG: 6-phosphogluconolactonase [Bacteroidota bacterium]|nr:6-phosphogluconolactonase [Bacteroidota bacterium]